MAKFLPNQLKFDLLKFQDASVLNTVFPQLNKPYYWNQLIADDDFYRDPSSRVITYGVNIKKKMMTGTNCIVALALMGKRLDSLAVKMLDPFATIFLSYRDRPDLFSPSTLLTQKLSNQQSSNPFLLPSLIDFFRVVTFQQLYSFFIGVADETIFKKEEHFLQRLKTFLPHIIASENEKLCNTIITWPLMNRKTYEAEKIRDMMLEYSRTLQITTIKDLAENYSKGQIRPRQSHYSEIEQVHSYASHPEYYDLTYDILIKQILIGDHRELDNYLSDNVPEYYYAAVFTLAILGFYGDKLNEFAVKAGNSTNPNNDSKLFKSLQQLIETYNLTPEYIISRKLPDNWKQLLETTNAVYEPFMLMIGVVDDVEKMKRLIAIAGKGNEELKTYFGDHWYSFGPKVYDYLLTLFRKSSVLIYRKPVLFETNVETVRKWVNASKVYGLVDPALPITLVEKLFPGENSNHLRYYLEDLSTTLVIPDIKRLFVRDPKWNYNHDLYDLSFYLREEIFAQLPTKYKEMILKSLVIRGSAEKLEFYRKL